MVTRRPAEAFPPGELLKDELEERGWTQADLAEILGCSTRLVNEIIAGKRGISIETAKGLAEALDTSPELWMNLDAAYRLWLQNADGDAPVRRRAKLYSIVPIREMIRRGWIDATNDLEMMERQVMELLETSSLDETPGCFAHAARKSSAYDSVTPAQLAWLCRTRQLARQAPTPEVFSAASLQEALKKLRDLLANADSISQVPAVLSQAGICFIAVEPLPGSRIDGACFWVDGTPVVAHSLRFDRIDHFWFTLFHELGHVVHHDQSLDVDLDSTAEPAGRPAAERRADQFAVDQLIPSDRLRNFMVRSRPRYSWSAVGSFAQASGVHPGIVVGHLQHRREIPWSRFRKSLVPVRHSLAGHAITDGWRHLPTPNASPQRQAR